jgi:hypothetical protein
MAGLNQDQKMEAINDKRLLHFQYCSSDVSEHIDTACTFRQIVIKVYLKRYNGGHTVVQLVEALHHKLEGNGFNSQRP